MIREFCGNYDRGEFYRLMGKFFAEAEYKKKLPHLFNKNGVVWYLYLEKDEVEAFGSYEIMGSTVVFHADYFERSPEYLEQIIDKKLLDLLELPKTIRTGTAHPRILDMFLQRGFSVYRRTAQYTFLRLEK